MRHGSFLALALLALTPAATTGAHAQAWPARQPIKLIIPFTPGSAVDAVARPVFDVGTSASMSDPVSDPGDRRRSVEARASSRRACRR